MKIYLNTFLRYTLWSARVLNIWPDGPKMGAVKNRSCTKELKSDISCHTSERSVHCLAIRQQSDERKVLEKIGNCWDALIHIQRSSHFAKCCLSKWARKWISKDMSIVLVQVTWYWKVVIFNSSVTDCEASSPLFDSLKWHLTGKFASNLNLTPCWCHHPWLLHHEQWKKTHIKRGRCMHGACQETVQKWHHLFQEDIGDQKRNTITHTKKCHHTHSKILSTNNIL